MNGTDAYRDAIEQTLAVTRAGRALIHAADHVRLLVEPDLTVLVLERIGWTEADYHAWSVRLLAEEIASVTPTRHEGRTRTRFALVHPRTTAEDLRLAIDSMPG